MNAVRTNPFVGLRPFEPDESAYYFGRGEHVKTLLGLLHTHRFLSVVGSSGSGKSSLIRAGLIPILQAGFLVQDRDTWRIAIMKPGAGPLKNLSHSVLSAMPDLAAPGLDEHSFLESMSRGGAKAVADTIAPRLNAAEGNLLLLVDQFEELFRFADEGEKAREEAADFVTILLGLARQRDASVYVCMTMRSDFLGDCDRFYGLPEALNQSQYLVPRLTRTQRRQAIEGPLQLADARISGRLLDRLLNETSATRDDLPILQHALMRTWDHWIANPAGFIDVANYEAIGGTAEAIDRHAEDAWKELSEADRRTAQVIFQAITSTDAANRSIRRPAHIGLLSEIAGIPEDKIKDLIAVFRKGNRHFVNISEENDPLIDLSHESLIRQWKRLSAWAAEEAEAAKIYIRLAETAVLHSAGNAELYRDADLQRTNEWQKEPHHGEAWARRYHEGFQPAVAFIERSRKAAEAERKRLDEQQREKLRLSRRFLAVVSSLLLVALVFAGVAVNRAIDAGRKSRILQEQTNRAHYFLAKAYEEKAQGELKAARQDGLPGHYQNALLYSGAALRQDIWKDSSALSPLSKGTIFNPEMLRARFDERWRSPSIDLGSIISVAFSPDGKTIVSGSDDQTIRLWNAQTGEQIRSLQGHSKVVTSVAFSHDGKFIVSGSEDMTIRLWNVQTGEQIRSLQGHSDTDYVRSLAFSPDGRTVVSGSDDNTVRLWSTQTGEQTRLLQGHSAGVTGVAFSPDGKTIVSGSGDETIRLWNAQTGAPIRSLVGHSSSVRGVAFSPDGKTIVSGSDDQTIRLWNAQTGEQIRSLVGHSGWITSVAFSPDGKTVVSGSYDQTIRLWNAQTGEQIRSLVWDLCLVQSVAFSPDGKTIVSGSDDGAIRLWDLSYHDLFISNNKPTPLFLAFLDGAGFLWGLEVDELTIKKREFTPTLFSQDGYNFVHDKKYRPLLSPPAPDQTKFDQVLEWAKGQVAEGRKAE